LNVAAIADVENKQSNAAATDLMVCVHSKGDGEPRRDALMYPV